MSPWSRTRLNEHDDTDEFVRTSSVEDILVSTSVYEGNIKGKAYHTNVEAMPMQTIHVPTQGIAVQSSVSTQEELV